MNLLIELTRLLISLESVGTILNECYYGNLNTETGGILVGPKEHPNIVTNVIPSTEFAERSFASYSLSKKDTLILNKLLREFQLQEFEFKGYFHKHPSGMTQLSEVDLDTCKNILQDISYKLNNFLIMIIVTESREAEFPMFAYFVQLDSKQNLEINKAPMTSLPVTCIIECAGCFEPIKLGEHHESHNSGQNHKAVN